MAGAKHRSEMVGQNPLAAEILARFGSSGEVTVERLESELAERERYDIVAALRELQKAGAGAWVGGRKGGRSRFVWARPEVGRDGAARSPVALAPQRKRAARPARDRAEPVPALPPPTRRPRGKPQAATPALLEHAFHIREGVLVSLRLPVDVTQVEMDRLCRFLKAIPFR